MVELYVSVKEMQAGIAAVAGLSCSRIRSRLVEARRFSSLKQSEVAEAIGCSRQTIGNIESGSVELTLWWLIALCQVYGESPAKILEDEWHGVREEEWATREAVKRKTRREAKIVDGEVM